MCGQAYRAAASVVLCLERFVHLKLLDVDKTAAVPKVFASVMSNIELARLLIQVNLVQYGQHFPTVTATSGE